MLRLLTEPAEQIRFHLHWSRWRRAHQATARRCHHARRARARPAIWSPAAWTWLPAVARPTRPELTDEQWARLQPLLPPQAPVGRPPRDARLVLAGVLWVLQTGASWRALPEQFGPWETIYGRYRRWCTTGLWPQLAEALQIPTTGYTAPRDTGSPSPTDTITSQVSL